MTQKLDDNGTEWEADHQETETHPLINDGGGKPIILRTFEFNLPPGMDMPNDQDIIDAHKSKITAFLWKDELVLIQELKVVKDNKRHSFRIFATCQAKSGSAILGEPQLIQNVMRVAKN